MANMNWKLNIRGLSCASALEDIFNDILSFRVMSDITVTNDIKIDDESGDIINLNIIESVFKLIEVYGGELYRNNYTIKLLQKIGQEKGILISYGKNLTGFKEELDITNVITRIKPIGAAGLTLPEKYIDSKNIDSFYQPKTGVIEFSDCTDYESLRAAAKKYFVDTKCDFPISNYKVNFIELSKTEEYKHYKILERVELGDIVTIKNKKLNLDLKCKVIKIKKNVLTGRTEEFIHICNQNEKGFSGIGYHFYVRKDGTIYKGRPISSIEAHCKGQNSGSIGICAEGAYDVEHMPEVQKQAVIQLCKYLCELYGIDKSEIYGHCEIGKGDGASSCPGDIEASSAVIVSQRYNCPMMKLEDFNSSGIKAIEVIQIGGKEGSNRYTTFQNAGSLI